ncbi:MAG: hypothetical protein WDA16_12670 [Candidatus Thermoplasmatota archaeon]
MSSDEGDADALANLHDGLAHPFRVMILRVLRKQKRMTLADLRRAVGEAYIPIEAKNLQFHLVKMQMGGIVRMAREEGRDVAYLVSDVVVKRKIV